MILCGITFIPGEKKQVKIPVPGGEALEAIVLCGSSPGKTLVITAGVHGCEYVGILALQKLADVLERSEFSGQVILLPLVFYFFYELQPVDPSVAALPPEERAAADMWVVAAGAIGVGWSIAVAALFVLIGSRHADQSLLFAAYQEIGS